MSIAVVVTRIRDVPGSVGHGRDYTASLDLVSAGTSHGPDSQHSIVILPKNVGLTITAEVSRSLHMPMAVGHRADLITRQYLIAGRATHCPDCERSIIILPKDIRVTITIEIARGLHVPGGVG